MFTVHTPPVIPLDLRSKYTKTRLRKKDYEKDTLISKSLDYMEAQRSKRIMSGEEPQQNLEFLLEKLSRIGVECLLDCKPIKVEDLQEHLKLIPGYKLLQTWRSEEEIRSVTGLQPETSSSSPVDISRSPASTNSKSSPEDPVPSIVELTIDRPYIFTKKDLYNYIKFLTDFVEEMDKAIEEKGKMIVQFFQQKPTNEKVKQILSRFDTTDSTILGPCVVLLLMAHFEEDSDALILQVDATATPALPDSPRLIARGETLTSVTWMLSVKGQVILSTRSNFVVNLAALFALFYKFRLEYQEEALQTLEFIQRYIVGINPTTGSESSAAKVVSKKSGKVVEKKEKSIIVTVLSLIKKLEDFEWQCLIKCITVETAHRYPDQEVRIKKMTFGEEDRKKGSKRLTEEKEVFLKSICAFLNSGGGVLLAISANDKYNYVKDGLGSDLESGLRELLHPELFQNFIQIAQHGKELHFYVRSWCPAERRAPLCTLNSGLSNRSGTSVRLILPADVMEYLLKRKKWDQDVEEDIVYKKACDFYKGLSAQWGAKLVFGESAYVELKSYSTETKLIQRLTETLPRYLSAFANTTGGFLFIGIDDKTKAVVGCGKGMTPGELEGKIREICNRAQGRAVHLHHCPKQTSWTSEVKVFPVTGAPEGESFIIVVKVPAICCAVFEEDPKSWVIEEGKIIQLRCSDWLKRMQRSIPEISPSSAELTLIHSKLFEEYPNIHTTFTTLAGSGIIIMLQSWAVNINRQRNEDVIAEALLLPSGDYPLLFFFVMKQSAALWRYAKETAFYLKQKLVTVGGYTGTLCVTPRLVCCETGNVIQNDPAEYPKSYTLDHRCEKIKALLRSLNTVLGSELFTLLTERQFSIPYSDKVLLICGVPGSEKTLLATEKIRQIKNSYHCEPKNILFLCESSETAMRMQNLCSCETRSNFMRKDITTFSDVKHIIVDEVPGFCRDFGDWYSRAQKLTKSDGAFWIFLDCFQRYPPYHIGLSPQMTENRAVSLLKRMIEIPVRCFIKVKKEISQMKVPSVHLCM